MSELQICLDASDLSELSIPQQLYLKPEAKLSLTVALPTVRLPGKTISNWEVTERLKQAVHPHSFQMIKVTKSTLEFIRFEAEIDNRSQISNFLTLLSGKTIRLSGFPEPLKVRAAEAKPDFPTKHDWDKYFRDAKNMNEMKPGERPDTVHITGLPSKWFADKRSRSADKPSETTLQAVFEVFGEIRRVDIPMLDPYRNQMKASISGIETFSHNTDAKFDAFIQYRDYISFVRAMDGLRGMKLAHKQMVKIFSASIKVDFDKTKHLSDASIQRRKIERDKLMEKEREKDEEKKRQDEAVRRALEEEKRQKQEEKRLKGERRKEREEKRKQKILKKLKRREAEQMSIKIAIEERKLLMAQRKLESIRLLDELLERVKIERQKEVTKEKEQALAEQLSKTKLKQEKKLKKKEQRDLKKKEESFDKEKELRKKLVKRIKDRQEQQMEERKERLRKTMEGKNILKAVLKSKNGSEIDENAQRDWFPHDNFHGKYVSRRGSHSQTRDQQETDKTSQEANAVDVASDAESSATSKYSHLNTSTEDESKPVKETWPGYAGIHPPDENATHPWVGYSDFYNSRFMRRGRRPRGGLRGTGRGSFIPSLNPNVPINSFYMQPINNSYYRYFNKLAKTDTRERRTRTRSHSSDRVVCRKVLSRSRSRSASKASSRSKSASKKNETHESSELSLSASDGWYSPERKATPLGKPNWESRYPRSGHFSYQATNYRPLITSRNPKRKSRSRERPRSSPPRSKKSPKTSHEKTKSKKKKKKKDKKKKK